MFSQRKPSIVDVNNANQPPDGAEYPSPLTTPQRMVVLAFIASAFWYLSWRVGSFNPDALIFSVLMYVAEVFGFGCALLSIFICWSPRKRTPPPIPADARVAVFVPTINESVDIVRRTLLSAQRMEYASEVWLLDDGNRPEMRLLAGELGCHYLARTENTHAKAGNLNNALAHTSAEFIAIFDADHAPAPAFLKETLGFFSDERVAFVQTPQDFYNLDSFQHRLGTRNSRVWSEQTLFFRVIQAGKDRWNAAFFCGSCGVVRRAALDDIGGFATGSVTEDIHTSIRLHKRGWHSVYHARSLAFGLAPATAIPFLKQRLRWGQGAMQVWRQEGVLFTRGLTLAQRLSYLGTMLAYFEGWQRGLFFLAPVVVLTTGLMPIAEFNSEFLVRFVPYYVLTFWSFEEVSRGYGRSLLTEQYNMLRFAVFITATFGFFKRRLRFVVTPKKMGEADATRRSLWPQFLVLALNAAAIPIGIIVHLRGGTLPVGALVANVMWAGITLVLAALAIRFSLKLSSFRRREYRFPLPVPLRVATPQGIAVGLATDISPRGFRLLGTPVTGARVGDEVRGELLLPSGRLPVRARIRDLVGPTPPDAGGPQAVGCEFSWDSASNRNQLEMFLFGSDLQWRLNGFDDRVKTPTERLGAALSGRREIPSPRGQHWSPLIYRSREATTESGVGFISAVDPSSRSRTVVALRALPRNTRLRAEEVTLHGAINVTGRVADEQVLETDAAPVYLYRLTA
jgi:cellulose synthase (UDP-forming)